MGSKEKLSNGVVAASCWSAAARGTTLPLATTAGVNARSSVSGTDCQGSVADSCWLADCAAPLTYPVNKQAAPSSKALCSTKASGQPTKWQSLEATLICSKLSQLLTALWEAPNKSLVKS